MRKKFLTVSQRILITRTEPSTGSVTAEVGIFLAIIASCVRSRGLWGIAWPSGDLGKVLWGAGDAEALLTLAHREQDRSRIFSCWSLRDCPVSQVLLRCALVSCSWGSRSVLGSVK